MRPGISIIIPAYNVEAYIRSTLESVKKQTYKSIEVIVVNDGSSDSTAEIAKQTLADAEFPWIVIDQKNRGVSAARNIGLSKASGEYVLFLDGDDIISEQYVEKMYGKAKRFGCDVVFCKYDEIQNESGEVKTLNTYDSLYDSKVHRSFEYGAKGLQVLKAILKLRVWIWTSSAIYKRDLLYRERIFFAENHWIAEDQEFLFKVLAKAEKVCSISETLAYYVRRPGSCMTRNTDMWEKMLAVKQVFEELSRTFQEWNLDKEINSLLENYSRLHLWSYLFSIRRSSLVKDEELFLNLYKKVRRFTPLGPFKKKLRLKIQKLLLEVLPDQLFVTLVNLVHSAKRVS